MLVPMTTKKTKEKSTENLTDREGVSPSILHVYHTEPYARDMCVYRTTNTQPLVLFCRAVLFSSLVTRLYVVGVSSGLFNTSADHGQGIEDEWGTIEKNCTSHVCVRWRSVPGALCGEPLLDAQCARHVQLCTDQTRVQERVGQRTS